MKESIVTPYLNIFRNLDIEHRWTDMRNNYRTSMIVIITIPGGKLLYCKVPVKPCQFNP